MNRRGFLGSILLAGVAPAIVRADSLMRIVPLETVFLRGDYTCNIRDQRYGTEYWITLPRLEVGQTITIRNMGEKNLIVMA